MRVCTWWKVDCTLLIQAHSILIHPLFADITTASALPSPP